MNTLAFPKEIYATRSDMAVKVELYKSKRHSTHDIVYHIHMIVLLTDNHVDYAVTKTLAGVQQGDTVVFDMYLNALSQCITTKIGDASSD